ncbi:MAG: ribonuclease HII [Spirochaetes bacterium]|nr:ribonuclease HII [Spirochaetota bacterium]
MSNVNNISFEIEKKLLTKGFKIIAGIDEAGRGALAGPLSVGLVIYDQSFIQNPTKDILSQIRDSKELSPERRIEALNLINREAFYVHTAIIPHHIIDKLNINRATEYAVRSLLKIVSPNPDIIIMDGNFKFNLGVPFIPVIKGDSKSITIASASIAAKVKRDRIMDKYELIYPGYSFIKNKGYGTSEHREAITRLGPCVIHRQTYEPVKSMFKELTQ